jgi:hypothetical protein
MQQEWQQRLEILLEQEEQTDHVTDAEMEVSHGLEKAIWDEISVSHEDGDGRAMLQHLATVVVVLMHVALAAVVLGVEVVVVVAVLMTLLPHYHCPCYPLSSRYLYLVWIPVSCSGMVGLAGSLHPKSQVSCWKFHVYFHQMKSEVQPRFVSDPTRPEH